MSFGVSYKDFVYSVNYLEKHRMANSMSGTLFIAKKTPIRSNKAMDWGTRGAQFINYLRSIITV